MADTATVNDAAPIITDNIKHLYRSELSGAGQVTVDGDYAYFGHMYGPEGTTIMDISDPRKPKTLITMMQENPQTHSHKVRVVGDIMVVNSEQRPQHGVEKSDFFDEGGFKIYDIKDKTKPKLITFHKTGGKGVHRFDMDENYLYISTEMEGFVGNILVIYDYADPANPKEVSRWWMPGQNTAAGEEPNPKGAEHRIHHAMRQGDRLYAGCWMSGYAIIDVSDISNPKTLGTYAVHPEAKEPSHTLLRVPFQIDGRDIAIAADEERTNRGVDEGAPHGPFYVFDVTDPANMKLLATHHVSESASPYNKPGMRFGAHQFRETMDDTRAYVTWFAAGLRILDIKNPSLPAEVGHFIPKPGDGYDAPQTNDVTMDHRGLLYVVDKAKGFDVIEFSG